MIFNMVGGGGAGGASIFIINSANERPTNVFNNTLWVNTDIDVVKYVFSDNEPSSPTEGMLWLTISDSDNINVAAPINKDWMKFNLGIVRQYIGGAWERKLAQLYKDGIWVDVSKLFSATINITYPANSNCVVTNSIGQTVASNTNTGTSSKTWTATVNASGTYTVTATATDGSGKSKSETVEITTEGQSVNVTLSYELILYAAGDSNAKWSTYKDGSGSVTFENTQVKLYALAQGSYGKAYIYYKELIKGGSYSKLSITSGTTVSRGISGITKVCIVEKSKLSTVTATNDGSGGVAQVSIASAKNTYTLDLSGLSPDNEYYVMAWVRGRNLGEDTAIQPSTLTIAHMILN